MAQSSVNTSLMDTAFFFDFYYKNAKVNSILIMDSNGIILNVNQAFTNNFGYSNEEIKGSGFNILFTKNDNTKNKPQLELETVLSTGQAHDENYVMDKEGFPIWCTGESLLVLGQQGEKYIVKDIVNLQAKKQLQLFLTETEEVLEKIFESSKDLSMMILDGSMKIVMVNRTFLNLFEIAEAPLTGSRLVDINHPFWNREDIRKEVRNSIVTGQPINKKEYVLDIKSGEKKTIRVDSKIIDKEHGIGKKAFLIIEDITPR